ncbi:MAG: hypothetical protein ACYSU0_00915, partial [Planctomycetota bacterium]
MPLQAHAVADIAAGTGFGGFGLRIDPGRNLLVVTVRCYFNVEPGVNQVLFLNGWRQKIRDLWNDKLEFQSAAGNLTAQFEIVEAGNLAGSHFPVKLSRGYAAGSGLKLPTGVGSPFPGRWYLELHDRDNERYSDARDLRQGLGANEVNAGRARALVNEHQRVVDELRALGTVTLDRAGNAWTIQNASQLRLRQFAAELRRCPSFLPQNPLTIEATSGLRDKATALVQVVRQFLANEGIRARLTDSPIKTKRKWRWPWTAHKPTATVVVSVDGMDQMLQAWRQSV